jgi:ABC-type lipoprotein release transport system permease subunit
MTPGRLVRNSLVFHWRGNTAVLLGVAVGTAVLTGALLVGDSLRGSLRDRVRRQLGWVEYTLVTGRFVTQGLESRLPAERTAGAILLRGAATRDDAAGRAVRRAARVTVVGVDGRFWSDPALAGDGFWESNDAAAVLNQALAEELGVGPGDFVTLHLQKPSAVPRETLLGRRDAGEVLEAVRLSVRAVVPDQGAGGFSLDPRPETPLNAFVPLRLLQASLGQGGRVNAILAAGATGDLRAGLRAALTLDDWRLTVTEPKDRAGNPRGYVSLESRQMFLEPAAAAAARAAADGLGLRAAPTLVYLANAITDGDHSVPYSVVAALDPAQGPPLGPFLPPGLDRLGDDEIVLADWDESPLRPRIGGPVTLTYFKPEDEGRLEELAATFVFRGFVPLAGAADDRDLTPDFPGITDKLTIRDWNPPFPYDGKRVGPRDERYWERYRTTPKAYVTVARGRELWASRFGRATSVRLAPPARAAEGSTADIARHLREALRETLQPEQGGLVFENVRARGLDASAGGTDFGMYFLGFSIFLIAAALLLVGLLFRLNLDRRAAEVGLLLATGFRRRKVRRLLWAEGAAVAGAGGLLGVVGALAYAWLMLALLRAWWPGGLDRSLLRVHVMGTSLLIGYAAALAASVLAIGWGVYSLGRATPGALLAGQSLSAGGAPTGRRPSGSLALGGLALGGALALLAAGYFIQDHIAEALAFFGSGGLLLTAGLAGLWAWLRCRQSSRLTGRGWPAVARLGVRNAARHPVRSLLTAGLLAFAVFVVISVEAFRRRADPALLGPHSGTGGFALVGDASLPVFQDLNTESGRDELNFPSDADAVLEGSRFYPFRLRAGDDASCLNLYLPTRPQVLGVPASFAGLGRFRFQAPATGNPWLLLDADADDAIPAFADATTAQYILKKSLGEVIEVPDERGDPVRFRLVGLLSDSIFQSQLLVSEAQFLRQYPNHEGYQYFLIDAPPERAAAVQRLMTDTLAERGFSATPTVRRLEAYWAVENTYLSTFQALGGLGLVLGALGLAVVLLRTAWERRGEMALLRAVGFRRSALGWLLLSENGFLLAVGLAAGAAAALAAVLPHVARVGDGVPLAHLGALLAGVLAVGLAAGASATAASVRAPLIPALRRE